MKVYLVLAVILAVALVPSVGASCSDEFLRRIQRNPFEGKTITIVSTDDAASFIERVGEGVPYGFNVDLMNLIGYIFRTNFKYVFKSFSELIAAVEADEYTISVSTQTITEQRIELIDFAQFFKSGYVFLVKKAYSGTIGGLSDLCGKKVSVLAGSTHQAEVEEQNTKCGSNQITIKLAASLTLNVQFVLDGSADVALGDEASFIPIVRESNNKLKTIGTPFNVQPYGIGCNKNNRKLCCALVNAINHLIDEEVYGDLLTRYSFTYANSGICPSRINLKGETCASRCKPSPAHCREHLS